MRNIIFFFIGTLTTLAAMFCFWAFSLGRYDGDSSSWLAALYDVKSTTASRTAGPKVVIVAGSNALFGVDSEHLATMIGLPVVNMASHAGLPLSLLAAQSIEHVEAGDIVVAPLEFEYYSRDHAPSVFESSNIESWASTFALGTVNRAITYFRSASMLRAARRVFAPPRQLDTPAAISREIAKNTSRGLSVWNGYSAKSMKTNGDILIDERSVYQSDGRAYISNTVRSDALSSIVEFKRAFENKGARFFLTWPVTVRTQDFDFRSTAKASAAWLVSEIKPYGLELECDPASFQFDQDLFLDTRYHLGLEGAERRTVALAKCLTGRDDLPDPLTLTQERRSKASSYDLSVEKQF